MHVHHSVCSLSLSLSAEVSWLGWAHPLEGDHLGAHHPPLHAASQHVQVAGKGGVLAGQAVGRQLVQVRHVDLTEQAAGQGQGAKGGCREGQELSEVAEAPAPSLPGTTSGMEGPAVHSSDRACVVAARLGSLLAGSFQQRQHQTEDGGVLLPAHAPPAAR